VEKEPLEKRKVLTMFELGLWAGVFKWVPIELKGDYERVRGKGVGDAGKMQE
jgi:hypothetical protein